MALQFMLKKKVAGKASIYLRYSYKESECLIASGKKIDINHWAPENDRLDMAKGKLKKPRRILIERSFTGAASLETYLKKLEQRVMTAATDLQNEGEQPTPEEVKKRYSENNSGVIRGAIKAVTLWKQFIKEGEGKKEPGTILNETQSLNIFKEYLKTINKPGLTLRRIDKGLITAYGKYLSKYADNTRAKRLKHLKAFLKSQNHSSTELVKFKELPGDKIFLTEAELTAIENYQFKPGSMHSIVRDLISLQCETGLRVSDLKRMGKEHLQGDSLLLRAKKNDEFIRMPISPKIAEILKRHNHSIPTIADQTYNEQIKEVAALAIPKSKVEISEHRGGQKTITTCFKNEVLTSHCHVRTFINLAAQRGMPIVSIARLTGKSVATLLKSYLKPDAEQAYKDAVTYARAPLAVNR